MPPITTWACVQCGKMMQPLDRWWVVKRFDTMRGPLFVIGELTAPPGAGEDVVCDERCAWKQVVHFMRNPNGKTKEQHARKRK